MNNIYIVEGETELKFLEYLLDQKILASGKKQKFNLWEKDVNKIRKKFSARGSTLYLIFDMDVMTGLSRFNSNLKVLSKDKTIKKIVLMPQRLNFEDELAHACDIGEQAMFSCFGAEGVKEFKSRFIGTKTLTAIFPKKLTLCQEKMWCRPLVDGIDKDLSKVVVWQWQG